MILKAIYSTKKSKRFTSQPSLQAFKRYISDMTFFHRTAEFRRFFCNSGILLICLIHLSLSNLYFYTIRSLTMFMKVLSKVNFKVLTQTKIISYYWLLLFAKLLELLAITHSSSERRIIFVLQLWNSIPIKGSRFTNRELFLDFRELLFENILKIANSFSWYYLTKFSELII